MSAAEQLTVDVAPARVHASVWRGDPLRRRLLAIADIAAASTFGLSIAMTARSHVHTPLWLIASIPLWLVVAKFQGLYDRDHRTLRHLTADELSPLVLWVATSAALTLLAVPSYSGAVVSIAVARAVALTLVLAVVFRAAARLAWRAIVAPARVVIVGEGALADVVRRKLELFPDIHAAVVAQIPAVDALAALRRGPLVAGGCDRVILATLNADEALIAELLRSCRATRTKLSLVPPARGRLGSAVHLTHVAELPVLEYNTWDSSRSTVLIKRVLDVVLAASALVVLLPVLIGVAVAVYAYDRGPILFTQRRAGYRGREFKMLKFRTMVVGAEARLAELICIETLEEPVFKLRRDPRVTPVGRLVRRLSLDELPQLVNVLRGEMSIVGPRPEQVELVDRYTDDQRVRLRVKPGMTGPMQVYGRGDLSLDERLAVEREYVENLSVGRDLRILALTLAPVLSGRGAY